MGWPRRLVLVRHAESEGNVRSPDAKAAYEVSTHNYPLTPRGRKQAAATGAWLRKRFDRYYRFNAHYVSYYKRSRQTMRIMYPKAKIYEDPRLAEGQRGIYHTMTQAQIEARFPEELKRKGREGLYHYRPFGGENWPDIELRIHSFLGTLSRDYQDEDVVIVVHAHWLILFQRLVERFSIAEALHRYHGHAIENASVSVYEPVQGRRSARLERKEYVVPWRLKGHEID